MPYFGTPPPLESIPSDKCSPLSERHPRRSFGPEVKREVWAMTHGRCYYCGLRTNPFATFTIDHIVPLARGGSNDLRNLVPACRRCNFAKGVKLIDEWTPARPFWFLSDDYRDNYGFEHRYTIWDWEMSRIDGDELGDGEAPS